MLKYFGKSDCPRCSTHLVHEFDLANDWPPPGESTGDQRRLCPNCGFSRPVVYAVERPSARGSPAKSA